MVYDRIYVPVTDRLRQLSANIKVGLQFYSECSTNWIGTEIRGVCKQNRKEKLIWTPVWFVGEQKKKDGEEKNNETREK